MALGWSKILRGKNGYKQLEGEKIAKICRIIFLMPSQDRSANEGVLNKLQ